ncbi:MAG: hypothetical protein U0R71_13460 [Solirubrobacterales bacterium]
MEALLALTAVREGLVLVLITALAAPIAGFWFLRAGDAWRKIGRGPFSIEAPEEPPRGGRGAPAAVDPAIQAAEVRQMLRARAARQSRRGEAPTDVEAEAARLLRAAAEPPPPAARIEAELRSEVRHLVLARNERRRRRGLEPLDVEAETDRQLADLGG